MRLTLDLETELPEALVNFCIYIAPQPQQLVVLSGNQTLSQVNEKFWKIVSIPSFSILGVLKLIRLTHFHLQANKPLEMYYSWKKS